MNAVARPALAAGAAALLLAGALFGPVAAAAAAPDTPAADHSPARPPSGNQITSFYFGKSNRITPVPPWNESAGQEAQAFGVSFPRALISNVGTWAVTLVEEEMVIESLDGLSIWGSSDQGAQNVRFTIQIALNGNSVGTLQTERKAALSSSPEEFRLDPGSSQIRAATFPKGSQLTFQLQYSASSSPLPIGPSADSTFHYYGDLYRSRVDMVTNPFNLTLAGMTVERDRINVTEIVKDAFGVDAAEKVYSLSFNGPTSSMEHHVVQVGTVTDSINGTTLIWNWVFAEQGAVTSGAYAVSLSAKYVGADVNYTDVSTAEIKFPSLRAQGGGFLPGPGALEGVAAVAAAAALVALAARTRARLTRPRR